MSGLNKDAPLRLKLIGSKSFIDEKLLIDINCNINLLMAKI